VCALANAESRFHAVPLILTHYRSLSPEVASQYQFHGQILENTKKVGRTGQLSLEVAENSFDLEGQSLWQDFTKGESYE